MKSKNKGTEKNAKIERIEFEHFNVEHIEFEHRRNAEHLKIERIEIEQKDYDGKLSKADTNDLINELANRFYCVKIVDCVGNSYEVKNDSKQANLKTIY